ncbi:UxaA family hydrolase [Pseudonocardia acaciae]|uniref:UxaA family hydrolase n=1 Tax=Pseudonocardia acaciae TaxID=551276 RepID=UPI00048B2E63|nr:UxaA family hydrolase [Pseudonocardia acaciae]
MAESPDQPGFLAHHDGDLVAVAVRDLTPGTVHGGYLRGPLSVTVELRDEVPLGHKLALVDIAEGQDVVEYGQRVGVALKDIPRGGYVHVHNVRSARWQNSVA